MEDLPSFYKIIMGELLPDVRIPTAFAEKYGEFFSEKATLKTEYQPAKSWDVNIEKIDGYYWLTHGWLKFTRENSLKFPDFVVFRLVEDSKFLVEIFEQNGCKRVNPPTQKSAETEEILKLENLVINFTFKWKKSMRNCLFIKESMCKKLGLSKQDGVQMKNLQGAIYDVKLFRTADRRVGFGYGWAKFVDESKFVEGRTYWFEFIRDDCSDEFMLQLSSKLNSI